MIKPNEVRIGNYLQDQVSKEWMVVDEISENIGAVVLNRDKYPLQPGWEMAGIPLTTEILEKCGFVRVYQSLKLGQWYLYDAPDTEGDWWLKTSEAHDFTVKIKFVHQLQNLYHALNGQELEVNL